MQRSILRKPPQGASLPEGEDHRVVNYSESEPAWVRPHPPRHNAEEIAEWVMADPDKAAEVWRALLDRLASSMSILFFSGHCIENPRSSLLYREMVGASFDTRPSRSSLSPVVPVSAVFSD
jgi:hypothetical protein